MAPEKEKITTMILYVDLKCPCCYKKVRKLLCKFPQIRDQVFDVDKNKVIITVVCCDPERFRDKLCCKGGRAIQSIEIVENKPPPPKPTPAPAPAPKPKDPPPKQLEKKPSGKPKAPPPAVVPVPEKPKPDTPKTVDPPKPTTTPPPVVVPQPRPAMMYNPPKPADPPKPRPISSPMPSTINKPLPQDQPHPQPFRPPLHDPPIPMGGYYPHQPFCPHVFVCCQECYEGRNGGPCHYGSGRPVPPPPCYDYYGYQYPTNRPCYVSRCDYFSEDNPQGCSIM